MDAITAEGLVKIFRAGKQEVRAVDGLDLRVEEGSVLGLLGPNGAGKTTIVRILSTLLRPDGGRAVVLGFDVVREAQALRAVIGLSGQYAAVDENLTGYENLVMFGRLYQLAKPEAQRSAREMLEQFDLEEASDRVVKTFSGGMRRRLDLAAALIGRPRLLFLDEPTTGLDPRSRLAMWEVIRGLVRGGVTILLTTQYLEEADALADQIAVVDHGHIIAKGTTAELKSNMGGERIEAVARHEADLGRMRTLLAAEGPSELDEDARRITLPANEGVRKLIRVGRILDEAGVEIDDIGLRRPTLDDVFLSLTGHRTIQEAGDEEPAAVSAGTRSE